MRARWYRSLYWRIAIGFVAFLAAMLVVQGVLFLWVVARSGRTASGESPERFAQVVAADLAIALASEPQIDIEQYLAQRYASEDQPFFVVLGDGDVITRGGAEVPEPLLRAARARLARRRERPGPPFGRGGFGGGMGAFGGGPGGPPGFAPVVVDGETTALVGVLPRAPFAVVVGRFGPILSVVAAGVLLVGAVVASVLVFGPARRRLRALEDAARRLGSGDLSVRAPEKGGDEIAAVASAFNAMAADLGERAEALAVADRTRRQLLADVSHELTTPVTAMRGYLETLTMPEVSLDEATRARYLSIIGDETARLERMIGDLLDLARLEGGGGGWSVEPVPVAALFDRVTARHERSCAQAGVRLETSIEPGAEAVAGDRSRLEQALQNLAANAMRYAPEGTAIQLTARPVGDGVAITVQDDGPGIAPEHLPHIFDRFYKVDASRSGAAAGSGLGLSIVKAIVERHGGRISVESRPGRTAFEMVLPAP
jgi:signal transduction histidine kinase